MKNIGEVSKKLYRNTFIVNKYSLKSRWIVAELFSKPQNGGLNIRKTTIDRDWFDGSNHTKVRIFKHNSSEVYHFTNNSVMA